MAKIIRLKNGSEVPESVAVSTMVSLEGLLEEGAAGAVPFYELTMAARDRGYQVRGNARQKLIDRALLQRDGTVHEVVRDIVRNAVEGEGLDMHLTSPIKKR